MQVPTIYLLTCSCCMLYTTYPRVVGRSKKLVGTISQNPKIKENLQSQMKYQKEKTEILSKLNKCQRVYLSLKKIGIITNVLIHSGTPVPCFSFACHYSNKADTSGGPPGVTATLEAMLQISLYVYQDFAELNAKNRL